MKFAFFTLLLTFAVFFNSIELGRSQQRDPDLSSSSDEEEEQSRNRNRGVNPQPPTNRRTPQGHPNPQAPMRSQGTQTPGLSLEEPGSRVAPVLAPVQYTRRGTRHHQNPPLARRMQGTQTLPGDARVHPYPLRSPSRSPSPPRQ